MDADFLADLEDLSDEEQEANEGLEAAEEDEGGDNKVCVLVLGGCGRGLQQHAPCHHARMSHLASVSLRMPAAAATLAPGSPGVSTGLQTGPVKQQQYVQQRQGRYTASSASTALVAAVDILLHVLLCCAMCCAVRWRTCPPSTMMTSQQWQS
jgi:hypothetical protein